jgi:hypothetical protein
MKKASVQQMKIAPTKLYRCQSGQTTAQKNEPSSTPEEVSDGLVLVHENVRGEPQEG